MIGIAAHQCQIYSKLLYNMALRIIDMTEHGSISGTVADSLTGDAVNEPVETRCNNDPNDD